MSYQAKLRVPVTQEDHSEGPADAVVTLLEYGDYECPYCEQAYPIVRRLRQAMEDDLRFIFRNFPLPEVHPRAMNAARAAEAAGKQGRFWEMHGLLFRNRENLGQDSLFAFAKFLGLDTHRFAADMENSKVERKIAMDIEGGVRSGVNGTPTFFVNGLRYDGDWSYGTFLESLSKIAAAVR